MTALREYDVPAETSGERIDKLLTALLVESDATLSRVRIQEMIKTGEVTVNGKIAKASHRVEAGDHLAFPVPEPLPAAPVIAAEPIPLDVVYEDDQIAAIHKPAGMVVHPAAGHASGTLVNAVLARWPQTSAVGEAGRSGIVHRLDKETSGVILIAKTEAARQHLVHQFKARKIQKRYLALVYGVPATSSGEITAPIGRDPRQRKRMAVLQSGRASITFYNVLESFGDLSLLEVLPKTGRTHQIRVHMAFIKHPVAGDMVYGRRKRRLPGLRRQFLHAEALTLVTPATGETITVHAPLPADLQAVVDALRTAHLQNS